jgi:hypothetical protein
LPSSVKGLIVTDRTAPGTLFRAIFGECDRVMTSEELGEAGFDDSREPDIVNSIVYM